MAAALIDAHAGGVGTLGVSAARQSSDVGKRLAYIFGTSACSMASAPDPVFVPGVWGPYYTAMIPGIWLLEGGQSAAGAALDRLVALHPDAAMLEAEAAGQGRSLLAHVAAHAETLGPSLSATILAARDMVVVPEFNGNRSPFADPGARAVISGLSFERGLTSLAALYLAGLSGIGYGLRQLLVRLRERGIEISSIVASGGAARSELVCQMLADTTGTTVLLPEREEPVLLGSAMLGGVAGGLFPDLGQAMAAMSGGSRQFTSVTGDLADLHTRRFACFEALQDALGQPAWTVESLRAIQLQLAKINDLEVIERAMSMETLTGYGVGLFIRESCRKDGLAVEMLHFGNENDSWLARLGNQATRLGYIYGPTGWHDASTAFYVECYLDTLGPAGETEWMSAPERQEAIKSRYKAEYVHNDWLRDWNMRRKIGLMSIPRVGNLFPAAAETLFHRRCLIIACELEKHRLRHGAYPATLPVLSGFDTQDPAAPSKQPGYKLEATGYVLTSAQGWQWRMKRTL